MGKFYNISLGVLFALIIALFVMQFTSKKTNNSFLHSNNKTNETVGTYPIAYFDVDSLNTYYEYSKKVQLDLENLKDKVESEVQKLENNFTEKQADLQKKAQAGMSQEDQEKAMITLNNMRQEYSEKREQAIANLQTAKQKYEIDLKKKIQDFIKEYNTPKRFSFIIADEPGFIYYRDTMLNITNDIVNGLNAQYKKN